LVITSAKANAAPVFDQMPINPPNNHKYNNKIAAALFVANVGTKTLSVISNLPNINAPTTMPPNKAVIATPYKIYQSRSVG